jgi:chemotaxis protein histidine kinase CheA
LARDYLVWAKADLDASHRHLAAAHQDPTQRPQHIAALFSVAHNIKGQGSSFGYPLMTRVGQSLCRLTRLPRSFDQSDLALIEAHLQLMTEIIGQEATGEGTPALRTNVTQIELLVDALGAAA